MINGVLVERTVKDILPALRTNSDGLKQVLDQLMKQYKTKQDEMDSWKVCFTPMMLSQTSRSSLEFHG
jgi:prefoldin subunit 2